MKFLVACAFHDKEDIAEDVVRGLFAHCPPACDFFFIFDGCADRTPKIVRDCCVGVNGVTIIEANNVFELYSNNIILGMTTADYTVIFQDDMILRGPKMFYTIKDIHDSEDNVGVIGFRDGFGPNYSNMYSAEHSGSGGKIIKDGEFYRVDMINRGPIAISSHTISHVGKLRTIYNKSGSYSEMDYCLLAKKAGRHNYVAGITMEHRHKQNIAFIEMDRANRDVFINEWGEVA